VSGLAGDVRLALRALARRPGFTAAAAGTLALAIAAVTVLFSVSNAVLLRPLSFPDADRLVQVYETVLDRTSGELNETGYFAWQNFADVRTEIAGFESITAWQYYDRTLTGVESAVRLAGRMVTPAFLDVLGVAPLLGRGFVAGDDVAGSERVAILGHGVWQRSFGGDPGIIGRTIRLDGEVWEVVGVMPAGFDFPYEASLWMPLVPQLGTAGEGARRFHRYRVAGRLADDATIAGVQPALAALAERLRGEFPETNRDDSFRAVALQDVIVRDAEPALKALSGAVAFLLLIACANIAGLLLARAVDRQREAGVRAALGASRERLARQMLVESLVLAMIGGAAGVTLALWGLQAFLALVGDALPRAQEVRLDGVALGVAALVTTLAGVAFGMVPALRHSRTDMFAVLRGGRGDAGDRGAGRLRVAFSIGELALAFVLVTGAGLLIRSFDRLRQIDTGVDPDGLVLLDVSLPEAGYLPPSRAQPFWDEFLARLRVLPGVRAAAAGLTHPLGGIGWGNGLHIEGRTVAEADVPTVSYMIVTPGWFTAAGIPLAGRDVEVRPDPSNQTVVINRTLAERYFPDQDPIGRRIRFGPQAAWATITGVAADVPPAIGEAMWPAAFVPTTLEGLLTMTVLVRTDRPAADMAGDVRRLVATMDPDVPVAAVSTLEDRMAESLARPRYTSAIVTLLAVLALLLASVGIYGVLAYAVSRRTREIGVRMAVGARAGDVLRLVLREGSIIAGTGAIIGIAGGWATTRILSALLFDTPATHIPTFAATCAIVIAVALLASWLPARRAARIDPLTAIMQD